ncbi:MAG TPA: hypothetical protein VFS67_19245 [Polyangiaceae bacterium]|nr:hypothetical protein [Polyangiaceae bacterium]
MLTRRSLSIALSGGSLLLASACGPRLTHDAKPPAASEIPEANMVVKVDPSKLDATHKLAADGQFTVGGLFFKDGESQDATVNVKLSQKDGATYRDYVLDLASVKGAAAKVDMWDDGTLTVIVPDKDDPVPGFETSNKNIKAVAVDFPGATAPSTCYFGKAILDMSIRFALCDLGSNAPPTLHFVDAPPDAPASAPPAAGEEPAAEAPAAEAPAAAAAAK